MGVRTHETHLRCGCQSEALERPKKVASAEILSAAFLHTHDCLSRGKSAANFCVCLCNSATAECSQARDSSLNKQ